MSSPSRMPSQPIPKHYEWCCECQHLYKKQHGHDHILKDYCFPASINSLCDRLNFFLEFDEDRAQAGVMKPITPYKKQFIKDMIKLMENRRQPSPKQKAFLETIVKSNGLDSYQPFYYKQPPYNGEMVKFKGKNYNRIDDEVMRYVKAQYHSRHVKIEKDDSDENE
jgi:hypothetical protein